MRALLVVLALVLVPVVGVSQTYLMNNQRTGQSPFPTSDSIWNVQYAYDYGERTITAPIISADHVYITTLTGKLVCVSLELEELWAKELGGKILGSPCSDESGKVYVGTLLGTLFCVSPDGRTEWHLDLGDPVAGPPAFSEGRIYVGTWSGDMVCVSQAGQRLWSYTTGWTISSAPTVNLQGQILVTSMDGNLYCLSRDGVLLWSFSTGDALVGAASVDASNNIYFGSYDGYLYSLDEEGNLRWRFRTGNQIHATPAISSLGYVDFPSTDGTLYSLTLDGAVHWAKREPCVSGIASPVHDVAGDLIHVTDCNAVVKFAGDSGSQINGFAGKTHFYAGHPTIGPNGLVYVASYEGTVYALGKELMTFVVARATDDISAHSCSLLVDDFEDSALAPMIDGAYDYDSSEKHNPGIDPDSFCELTVHNDGPFGRYLAVEYLQRSWLKAIIQLSRFDASGYDGVEVTMWADSRNSIDIEFGLCGTIWRAYTIRDVYVDETPTRYRFPFSLTYEGWSDSAAAIPNALLRNLCAIGLFPRREGYGTLYLDDVCFYSEP